MFILFKYLRFFYCVSAHKVDGDLDHELLEFVLTRILRLAKGGKRYHGKPNAVRFFNFYTVFAVLMVFAACSRGRCGHGVYKGGGPLSVWRKATIFFLQEATVPFMLSQ